jgi:glycogen synthase
MDIKLNLKKWRRDWKLMSVFFNGDEIAYITDRLKNLKIYNAVLCSFENRFAKSGGLAAVTTNILPFLKEINNIQSVILMTPYYPLIMSGSKLISTGISFNVLFNNKTIKVELLEYNLRYGKPQKGSLKEYYLKAEGFFGAGNGLKDPYTYDEKSKERSGAILNENAVFFCKAVPLALNALNIRENIIFHLHEWQTALISLTAKEAMLNGKLKSCGTVQTMHNSYDSKISWDYILKLLDGPRRQKVAGFPGEGLSFYQIGLQLVDAPVTTVSEHFARELTSDIIQAEQYAPHLHSILTTSGVYGIDNGMFVDFSPEFQKREKHSLDEIREIKLKNRRALLRVLSTCKPSERFGDLTYHGGTISKLPDNIPIIVMTGRLDTVQKGYYVLLRAIEKFSEDEIKVILAPMPVHHANLDYFYEVACKCKGNVTVFPLRMEKGYHELQTGATFGVMPSIYEPFGAAVEYMASGTVNIGRATGGLVDQIDRKCGFLYKEDSVFCILENVRSFIESADIVQMRKTNPWAQSMADNLYEVLRKAINVYQNHPDDYYQMILNGFKKAKQFNWEANAKKYYQVYEMVSKA